DGFGDRGERRPHGSAARRARDQACGRRLRAASPLPHSLLLLQAVQLDRHRARGSRRARDAERQGASLGGRGRLGPATPVEGRARRADPGAETMSDTVVFIPAWNEEENLPAVFEDLAAHLPDADVLVVDDGSTDRTAEVAREHGAEVLSLGATKGRPVGIAAGSR